MLDSDLLYKLSVRNKSFVTICKLFGLTEEEIDSPNAGEWIVDNIKQFQTAATIVKSLKMRANSNQNIENYNKDPLENKPLGIHIPGIEAK